MRANTAVLAWALLALAAGLGACSDNGGASGSAEQAPAAQGLHGTVHGGQSPISGSSVVLYAASENPLTAAAALATATSDSQGNFTFATFSCPSYNSPLYVTSTGGNAGGGFNPAIHLMAIVGTCTHVPGGSLTVNELTTVAAAYTVNNFIGPNGCSDCSAAAPADVDNISGVEPGLANAFGNASLLVDLDTGLPAGSLPSNADCLSTAPASNCLTLRKIDLLANALAACVNTVGPSSAGCAELFQCATPGATYTSGACTVPGSATPPADTLQAILSIARNPVTVSLAGINNNSSRNAVFAPVPAAAPTDLTVSLHYNKGGYAWANGLAIDAQGNAWLSSGNSSSLIELSPKGQPLNNSPIRLNQFPVSLPGTLAIDQSGDVWVTNNVAYTSTSDSSGVYEFNSSGQFVATYAPPQLNQPQHIAVDLSGNLWLDSFQSNTLTELSSSGAYVVQYTGGTATGSQINDPEGVAVDPSGNIWLTNVNNTGGAAEAVSELSSVTGSWYSFSPVSGGGMNGPQAIAFDPSGDAWVSNANSSAVSEISPNGLALSGNSGFSGGGIGASYGLAADAAGRIWIADYSTNVLSELSNAGVPLSSSTGFQGAGLANPFAVAVDPSGNVWVSNVSATSNGEIPGVTVFYGIAAPTRTPLVAAMAQGFVPTTSGGLLP
jgi:streptogramin lyase